MADPKPEGQQKSASKSLVKSKKDLPSVPEASLTPIQALAAQLYGRGYTTSEIAKRLVDYIVKNSPKGRKYRLKVARNRLRKWSKKEKFRDAIYDTAIIQLDLDSPAILKGIGRKAKAGRVDAARLAFELSGRHNPKGDTVAPHVEVFFGDLPRPQRDADIEIEAEEATEAPLEDKLPLDDEV